MIRFRSISLLAVIGLLSGACVSSEPDQASTQSTTTSATSVSVSTIAESTAVPPATTEETSTTTSAGPPPCRPDPFGDKVAELLAADYPGKLITPHVHDLRTGCGYSLNPDNRQTTASVFKVMVLAGTLLEAQKEGRAVSEWEMSQLVPMITASTNPEVRSLWRSFGGSPWFAEQVQIFGLDETNVAADGGSAWGLTTTSARDQVDLLRQLLIGDWGPIGSEYRGFANELMTAVVPEQSWGVTAGVPEGWVVAQKNGFAGITINSVGWADEPGPGRGYVVAILSQGWPDHSTGIAVVERVSGLVASAMIAPANSDTERGD